jgi:hypothetical protein
MFPGGSVRLQNWVYRNISTYAIMAAKAVHYSYEPLKVNQIRVVDLSPGLESEALQGKITHFEISASRSDGESPRPQSSGSVSLQEGGENADGLSKKGLLNVESFIDQQDSS